MNRHCIPRINYVHSPDGELLCGSVREQLKLYTGFSAYTYCIMPTPRCYTEETGRYVDLRGKICVVFWMLSVNSNRIIKGIVISFMFMDI